MFVVTDLSSYRLSLSPFILSFSLLLSCLAVPLLQVLLLFQPDDYISRFTRESSFSAATFPLRHLHLPHLRLPSTFSLHISKAFFFLLWNCPTISTSLDPIGDFSRHFRASGKKTLRHFLWVFRTSNLGRQLGHRSP